MSAAQLPERAADSFDWTTYRTTPVDLIIEDSSRFQHRVPGLNPNERDVYRQLILEIENRRKALRGDRVTGARAEWESAFYEFTAVRERAWSNGALRISQPRLNPGLNPLRPPDASQDRGVGTSEQYDLGRDIANHPEAFCGRPVVLIGLLRRIETADLSSSDRFDADERGLQVTRGELTPLSGRFFDQPAATPGKINPDLPLSIDIDRDMVGDSRGGGQSIAIVDTASVHRTSGLSPGLAGWPRNLETMPVLVKGWVVKLWDHRPLIYCESVREISPQSPIDLLRNFTKPRRPILPEESWLYHEILAAEERISPAGHRTAAAEFLTGRLEQLLREMAARAESDMAALERRFRAGELNQNQLNLKNENLDRLVRQRIGRYRLALEDPTEYDTFVDLFLNPDVWQGQPITLQGHVRHVVSYPAESPLFDGRVLHELWLYTDDSQHNPAVVVTSRLPEDFPVTAEVIDKVRVTGCVFKEYAYRGQDARRVAPLILAGQVAWNPSDSDILVLADAGHISAGSPRVQRAAQSRTKPPGGTLVLVVSFAALVTVMILWGRGQRERQDRRNLLDRVNDPAEFETVADDRYSPRLSDFTGDYDL